MYAHRSLVLVVVLSLLLGPVAPAAAAEDPRFVTTVSEPTIQPGETQTVTVTFENDAKEVDDASEHRCAVDLGERLIGVTEAGRVAASEHHAGSVVVCHGSCGVGFNPLEGTDPRRRA